MSRTTNTIRQTSKLNFFLRRLAYFSPLVMNMGEEGPGKSRGLSADYFTA
ncbi:MAG TPA: hypothetical protein VLE46_12010 [Nitrospira sp.]|nr:hypothetical protein [Nitrospira sp.]